MGNKSDSNDIPHAAEITDFAPADYTDGRAPLEWETKYPKEAHKKIRCEAWYIAIIFAISVGVIFYLLFISNNISEGKQHWMGCIYAWLGGTVGGTLFSIKWLYHSVAKRLWHQDRFLWRIFSPHLSGAIAFFTILITGSGLLKILNKELIENHLAVLGFSFLAGYFSDKALAKLSEIADTLFGPIKKNYGVDRKEKEKKSKPST